MVSGVTTAPATPAVQGGGTLGGRHIPHITEFTVFGVQKAPGGQEAYKKNRKKSGDLFFFFWRQ